jgi:nitrogenase molybdenum-iron protein alpha chain
VSNINLSVPAVAVREIRLNTITGFAGNASELVQQSCSGGLGERRRSFTQCLGCSTSNAACKVVLVQDGVVISHGPVGCSACLHEFAFTYRVNAPLRGIEKPTPRHVYSTNLTEDETVFGGNEKLAATIREVFERDHPAVIFIITTCASGIIGDDVEGIADEAAEELGVPVVAIFCEGFRSKVWTSGFDASYHAIARKLINPSRFEHDPATGTSKRVTRPLVNVVNFWGSDIFNPWFERFGVRANYLTPYATLESLRYSSEALASVQVCLTLGSYLGGALESEFGVPTLRAAPPYGVPATERWLRALGALLEKPEVAEQIIEEERAASLPRIAELRSQLQGTTAYVTAGAGHGHALLALLGELGIQAVGAALFHHDPLNDFDAPEADQLAARVGDYGDVPNISICNKQEFELVNVLNRVSPDLLLARHGGMTLWGAKLGIPSLLIGDEQWGMGFEGVVKYGESILEVLENDEFVTNLAKHAINPYTQWWLSQEPYRFLEVE